MLADGLSTLRLCGRSAVRLSMEAVLTATGGRLIEADNTFVSYKTDNRNKQRLRLALGTGLLLHYFFE